MKKFILAAGFFAAAFAVTAAFQRMKRSRIMTFRELYENNDVELDVLING
ncbi:MAG: hypothetical protein HFJ89_02795 [Oscillospiraceae bacterium]|nr:hypothetical protein [Oscillospiraceae bacterium]